MIIYEATKGEFLNHAFDDTIAEEIIKSYILKRGAPHPLEITAWTNSMQYMYKVLSDSSIPDDAGIAIEFMIPLTSKRIDFIITGYDGEGKGSIVIVELKQWSFAKKVLHKEGLVETALNKSMRETTHPSYQIWTYYNMIKDFNESVQSGNIEIYPCAYLHNFKKEFESEITDEIYMDCIKVAPLYLSGDAGKLRSFIEK